MTIDRQFLRTFHADALDALKAVAKKHGVTIAQKAGSYARDGSNATLKFEIATIGNDGQAQTKAAQAFKRDAARFGIDPEALGTTFTSRGVEYRITGLNTRRPKYPISADRVRDGRAHKFPASVVAASKGSAVEGLTPEIKASFADLACQLSPENLSCDGECSPTEVRRRRQRILIEWRTLEARAGRTVDESDTYGW
jgi:hypothetical protein